MTEPMTARGGRGSDPGGGGAHGEKGLSAVVSLVAIAVSLVAVLVLTLVAGGVFAPGKSTRAPAIFSNSRAEQQLQLCVEGRPSTYGDPPTAAQQAACTEQLAAQVGASSGAP